MRRALLLLALLACRNRHHEERAPLPEHAPIAPAATGPCAGDAVKTADGCVRGKREGDVRVFRGIPYAAPPVGALRWKPPQPPAAWTVRDAFVFGPSCPQLQSPLNKDLAANEDCLTLNVWSPAGAAKLPVMVWIHGGGLVAGGAAQPTYDGAHLASGGKVVLVSINYRLGPLGFLAHPALSSGNLGIHDQIAALRWVQREIAGFGGDPASVTIFGESAGGESVCALMASPLAKGLFARAIIESAQCVSYGKALRPLHTGEPEGAEEQGLRVAKAAGCPGTDAAAAACLRGKSADELLRAAPPALGFLSKGEHYGLTVDGALLPSSPADALAAGKLAEVPLIIGTTKDEATLFTTGVKLRLPVVYTAIVRKLFPGAADRIVEIYAPDRFGSPKKAFDALVTDLVFACPARRTARTVHQKVWRYLFTVARDPALGATHGSELGFVFGTVNSPSASEAALSQRMQRAWTQFAHTGDPGTDWPAYTAGRDVYLELATTTTAARVEAGNPGCDVLDKLAPAGDVPTED
jgi:para-nitrobenzyl esterase